MSPAAPSTDFAALISERSRSIDVSGIRRIFELSAKLADPINLSIGQPDFAVPAPIKQAAIAAIENDRNGYTLTQGTSELLEAIAAHLSANVGWSLPSDDVGLMVTSGTSGALLLAFLAILNPGDEAIIADPYFVIYPNLATLSGARAVYCDIYPDLRLTAARVEPLLTRRTKILLVNSPANPSGVVCSGAELRDLVELCTRRRVLLISDEIYDQFTYPDALEDGVCPSPARFSDQVLLVRGFGKSYGCTGWRMGYAAGPRAVIEQMAKLQQYTFVCAPSMAQAGCAAAFDVDLTPYVQAYRRKRDLVLSSLQGAARIVEPGGAFYAFVEVPPRLGLTATQFAEKALERNVLVIPGRIFSRRDTHLRISFAVSDERLEQGLTVLRGLLH